MLPKVPKLPSNVKDDDGASLIRCLFEAFTDNASTVNQLVKEIDRLNTKIEALDARVKALGG
jgi:outer membrane murein-binding lipoprotein Lpp